LNHAASGSETPLRRLWVFALDRHATRRVRRKRLRIISSTKTIGSAWPPDGPLERKASIYQHGVNRPVRLTGVARAVPAHLNLRDNWDETVTFLRSVRSSLSDNIDLLQKRGLAKPDRRFRRSNARTVGIYSDFTTIKSIVIPVALILASEYDRTTKLFSWAPFAIDIEKWHPDVRILLQDIGFLELAGVDRPAETILEAGSTKLLRLRCGDNASGEAVGAYMQQLGVDLTKMDTRLYDAISEAITNIVHHAYKDENLLDRHSIHNWWLVAASTILDDSRRRLQIVVYDQGASIPRTLPSWDRYPLLKRKLTEFLSFLVGSDIDTNPEDARYDGDAIRLAIEVGRSSTDEGHRGKGLDQIVKALELCQSGTVAIYSRQGEFRQTKGEPPQSVNRAVPMVGTLVSWDLTI
jgi:hypothetical protein